MANSSTRIAISIGDPNGIGPEIALKAAALHGADSAIRPILVGDEKVLTHYRTLTGIEQKLTPFESASADDIAIRPVDALDNADFQPGAIKAGAGKATIAYVTRCVELVREGLADAIVGCPQSETAIAAAGIEFSGYPPLIADLTGTPRNKTFMMLCGADLRIGHVTLHEPLTAAVERLTVEFVADAIRAVNLSMKQLGFAQPKIGVFGINPHAGEDGLFGDDDERITKPAAAQARSEGILADGPIGADVLLANRRHDAYVAMYHDQGHVPVKLISPRQASALAIGTPVVFSSVGHGCAYDIAGKGIAEPLSVTKTLELLATASAGKTAE
ncbi:MAG: 4-hydroxythreonine-4-phosphate dehydrogenase PdxA [Hyphomicrobiales bacterium]|nr:4-hydroxythreonine-4-phosphate dehydrogenase PdxA [Hyphomicrobiales bacterium]